jgi:hypothetical protein
VAALEAALAREQRHAPAAPGPAQTPDNPAYIQLEAQLAGVKSDRDATAAQIAQLRAQVADYQRKIAISPQTEKDYREVARDYQNSQAKYQEIRAKQMEAQIAQNLEADRKGERFTLIEPPLPPEEPVSPNRAAIWIIGIVLTLGLAGAVAALRETLDGTVRGRQDMLELLSDAPLTLVPAIGTPAEAKAVRQRLRYALGAAAVAALSAVVAIHFMFRPMDVLWFQVLRKLGM